MFRFSFLLVLLSFQVFTGDILAQGSFSTKVPYPIFQNVEQGDAIWNKGSYAVYSVTSVDLPSDVVGKHKIEILDVLKDSAGNHIGYKVLLSAAETNGASLSFTMSGVQPSLNLTAGKELLANTQFGKFPLKSASVRKGETFTKVKNEVLRFADEKVETTLYKLTYSDGEREGRVWLSKSPRGPYNLIKAEAWVGDEKYIFELLEYSNAELGS